MGRIAASRNRPRCCCPHEPALRPRARHPPKRSGSRLAGGAARAAGWLALAPQHGALLEPALVSTLGTAAL